MDHRFIGISFLAVRCACIQLFCALFYLEKRSAAQKVGSGEKNRLVPFDCVRADLRLGDRSDYLSEVSDFFRAEF